VTEADDNLQRSLGRIMAQNDEHARQLTALFVQLDAMKRDIAETSGLAKEAIRQGVENARVIHSEIQPITDDYKNLKAKGYGVLSVVALIGGGAAIALEAIIKGWKG